MTEAIGIAKLIRDKIMELTDRREQLADLARKNAVAMANYDRAIAITILKLKNGVEMELDGETILNPPTTVIPKLAHGICHREKLEADSAQLQYRNAIKVIECIQVELNGYQSIFRHLE